MAERGYLHPFLDGSRFDYGVGEDIRTLIELRMCRFSYYIRSQLNWWDKLEDEETIEAWKQAGRSGEYMDNTEDFKEFETSTLTERQIQWVLDELPAMARRIHHSSGSQMSCFERIWESDISFPVQLRKQLCSEITTYYTSSINTRETKAQDPTSPIIHDFIHPFDYPLLSNRTLCYEDDNGTRKLGKAVLSTYVTAIPTEFYVHASSSSSIEQMGYINNLPPTLHSSSLSSLLRQALATFIPLFEDTLTSLHRANHFLLQPRIISKPPFKYERGEDPPDEPGQGIGEGTDDEEDAGLWTVWGVAHHRWVQSRKVIPPELPMPGFEDLGQWEIAEENRVSLRGKRIQISIQLNRIELTPERPLYDGSHWKCHGSLDDHIVANGCIVLEESNLTPATLDFRMAVTRPMISYDDPNSACEAYWGIRRGAKLNQNIGSVRLSPGKSLVYPNLYQHRLSPFTLVDPSKPGYRTTLQFALVDPEIPVLSSSDIPPQQAAWALQALMEVLDKRIPTEVVQKIIDFAIQEKWLISEKDRWVLRAFVDMTRRLDREMLKRFFEETL